MNRMSRIELAVFALAWLAAIVGFAVYASGAEPPAIVATANGTQLILTPTLPPASGAVWRVVPGAKAGCWDLILVTATGGQPTILDGALVLTFGTAPQPGPTPGPLPIPPDPPVPVPTVLWGIVVEESSERTAPQAVVILSPKIDALFKATGGKFQTCDPWDAGKLKDVGPLNPYAKRADATKIRPSLFIVSPDGTVYFEGKMPEKVAEVEALVEKIRKGVKP